MAVARRSSGAHLDAAQREAAVLAALSYRAEAPLRARHDVNAFIETCMTDESGAPLRQAPFHRLIHETFTAHEKVVLFANPETGKTVQTAARLIWEVGRNPSIRVLYVGATSSQAGKVLQVVKQNIEHNDRLRAVFPWLRRDAFRRWQDTAIDAGGGGERERLRGGGTRKDFTVQAIGSGGAILGSRVDIAVLDDVVDLDNSSTPARRRKLVEWFETTLLTRIVDGGRVWLIGTPWHKSDLPHVLEERGVHTLRLPVEDGAGRFLWPERWNQRRLDERRAHMSAWRFRQQYYMEDSTPEGSPFSLEKLQQSRVDAGRFGHAGGAPAGWQVVIGVDLAVGKDISNDLTAFAVLATDGTRKQLIDLRAGRFALMEIRAVAEALFARYGGIMVVESNAAQSYLVQLLTGTTRIPVVASTTTRGTKVSEVFGIPAMAIDIENGRWSFPGLPSEPGEVKELFDEMVCYSTGAHTGDRLMATYLAWTGVDRLYSHGGTVSVRVYGEKQDAAPVDADDEDEDGEANEE